MDSKGRRVRHYGFRRIGIANTLLYCYTRERMDGGRVMLAILGTGVILGLIYCTSEVLDDEQD